MSKNGNLKHRFAYLQMEWGTDYLCKCIGEWLGKITYLIPPMQIEPYTLSHPELDLYIDELYTDIDTNFLIRKSILIRGYKLKAEREQLSPAEMDEHYNCLTKYFFPFSKTLRT